MSDVLCIYYSRTGHTKKAMEEIAEALDAELVELNDGVDRSGLRGARWAPTMCSRSSVFASSYFVRRTMTDS